MFLPLPPIPPAVVPAALVRLRRDSVGAHPANIEFAAFIRYNAFMVKLDEKCMTDRAGRPTDVVLSRKDHRKLLDYLEDLQDRLEIRKRKRGAKFVAWESAKACLKTK